MWNFLSRVLNGSSGDPTPSAEVSRRNVGEMLKDINEGALGRALPTLVCRSCGLKYENVGTYLRGSACPDCSGAH
jgi:hypothetical protein